MPSNSISRWTHHHNYQVGNRKGEKNTRRVIYLTLITMCIEIISGFIFGSMALLADGWHMGTHALALGISLFAYIFARKNANNPKYSFGTGKVNALGGFGSAVFLFVIAIIMAAQSSHRILFPVEIHFNEAIFVAVAGLIVNIISAWILQSGHQHFHLSDADHHHSVDVNLKAAYLHVLADALTSLLAIVALLTGKYFGWIWMDPMMGIVGAIVIVRWSVLLIRETGSILLDAGVDRETVAAIKARVEAHEDNLVTDIHIWRIGTQHLAAIISIATTNPKPPEHYKALLSDYPQLDHIAIEVNPANQ